MTIKTTYSTEFDTTNIPQITSVIVSNGYLDTTDLTQTGNLWTAWTSVWDETVTVSEEDARPIIPENQVKQELDSLSISGLTVEII